MSVADIRNEIDRGGRLVIYTYCVSLMVVTFKRSAGIRLIKAGHSPAAASWPFVLLSLVAGWWGFPWGPIYTIETIYKNLSGGIDVTEAFLRDTQPQSAAGSSAQPLTTVAPVAESFRQTPARPRSGFNAKVAALMAGAAAALIVGGISIYCYQQQQNFSVLLVSGLDRAYDFKLNGERRRLAPHGNVLLHLPEGAFTVEDDAGAHVVGAAEVVHFEQPFFDHLGRSRIGIINPDRAAVVMQREVIYYSTTATAPSDEKPGVAYHANQLSYFIAQPDFVLVDPDEKISMPSGSSRLVKTRLDYVRGGSAPNEVAGLLAERVDYATAREHLMILARHRSDEPLLRAAVTHLKPADLPAFFQLRLEERPVLVEWHRYYQQTMETTQPQHDLVAEYRRAAEAEPDEGALRYLLGRTLTEPAEVTAAWHAALSAPRPCAYAHIALGFDLMTSAQFESALTEYQAAEKEGIASFTAVYSRRDVLVALHRFDELETELAAERKKSPLNLELAGNHLSVVLAAGKTEVAERIKAEVLAAVKKAYADESASADAEAYLKSVIAYQQGDLATYAGSVARFHSSFYDFRAAIAKGDFAAAEKAANAEERTDATAQLELYLLAQQQGLADAAEAHYQRAIAALQTGSHELRYVARLLTTAPFDLERVCELRIPIEQKSVLLTAVGVHEPNHRARLHALAAQLDYRPDFPHHLLKQVLATGPLANERRNAGASDPQAKVKI